MGEVSLSQYFKLSLGTPATSDVLLAIGGANLFVLGATRVKQKGT